MHVAYLIPTIDRIGGAERQLILLATNIARRGWQVSVIALSGTGGDSLEELSAHEVSFFSLEMRKGLIDLRGWIRLHRWLDLHRPDIIHAHLPHAALLARWSRLASPRRVLIDTIHSPSTGGPLRRFAYRISSPLPDLVTAVSASAAAPWLNAGMVRHPDLAIIPNGIDLNHWTRNDDFREVARLHSGFSDKFVWLAVGRLDPVKDHATLLCAFARLPVRAHLVLAGTGPLEPTLRQLSIDLNIADRVVFLGFADDVRNWMRQADGFVLNSRWEGLPLALIEACACELPAVITNTAGSREVLPNSLLTPVPINDPDALAKTMEGVMSLRDDDRRNLGIHERQSVAARFGLETVLDRYETLYRAALSMNPKPRRRRTSASIASLTFSSSNERSECEDA